MKRLVWLMIPFLVATACKGSGKTDPILALSAEESLAQGKALLEQEKYYKARRYLTHAFEVAPNTTMGREALLLAADTFYLQGGESNYVQAEAKYRDYQNRFPTSELAAYVQFQLGNCLAQRTKKADRDQTPTEKALQAYDEVLRLYPTSDYAAQARDQIRIVRSQLAEHEFGVGRFYINYGIPVAAINRFTELLEKFPDYQERDKVLFFLGKAYVAAKLPLRALEKFGDLRQQFPESPWIKKIPQVEIDITKPEQSPDPDSKKEETAPTPADIKGGS
jgi:outer membrane protein assembly factor BamD